MMHALDAIRNLLVFLVLLGSAILAHEVGHLLVSVVCRVRIREIGLGIPPRLARLATWRGTQITLNWIPLGGFILPEGEFDPRMRGGFAASSPWTRLAVLAAGPLANLIFGFLVLTAAFMIGGPHDNCVRLVAVSPASPAEAAGLLPGDILVEMDGAPVQGKQGVKTWIYTHLGQAIVLRVQRGQQGITTSSRRAHSGLHQRARRVSRSRAPSSPIRCLKQQSRRRMKSGLSCT